MAPFTKPLDTSILNKVQAGGSSSNMYSPVQPAIKPVVATPTIPKTPTISSGLTPVNGMINGIPQAEYNRLDTMYKTPAITPSIQTPVSPQSSMYGNQGVQVDKFGEALYNVPPLNVNPVNSKGAISSTSLGTTTTSDVLNTRNYLEKLQNQILSASMAGENELTAQKNVNDLAQQELELKNKLSQEADRLSSSSDLTKEQATNFLTETYRRANVANTNLSLQKSAQSSVLQNEQLARQSQLDAFKTLYGISSPVSVGGNLVNPATGEILYQGTRSPVSLSAGETLVDPITGQVVAGGATTGLLSIAEATQLGVPYGTTREQAIGLSPASTKALSGEASKLLSITETVQPEIQLLKDAFTKNYKTALLGITTGTNRELVKLVDQVADKVGRLRSGGAINTDEATRFKKQIASFMDIPFGSSDSAIKALDGILAEAQSVASSIRGGGYQNNQTQSTGNNIVQTKAGAINVNW